MKPLCNVEKQVKDDGEKNGRGKSSNCITFSYNDMLKERVSVDRSKEEGRKKSSFAVMRQ